MIRQSAFACVILMLSVAASPATAFGIPAGATMIPMNGMPMGPGGPSTVCTCGMPMHTPVVPPSSSGTRSSGGQEYPGCNGAAVPIPGGPNGTAARVGGIRRIYPKNVLNHPDRAAVYAAIAARPGIDAGSIGSEVGMNRETLRYHLDRLEAATKIVVLRDHGIVRYYENHGRYTSLERRVLQHFWNPTGRAILVLIATRPGIMQAEISTVIAVTATTVRWYLQRFRSDSIITVQRDGKYTRYAVVPEAVGFIAPAPGTWPVAAA